MEFLENVIVAAGNANDRAYESLETLCISFPGRVSGSEILEHALDYLYQYGCRYLPANSCKEELVTCVPCWVRGGWRNETCILEIVPNAHAWPVPFPLQREIRVLANGLSVGTGEVGVQGRIVVVSSFEELKCVGEAGGIENSIVLFDFKHYTDYGTVAGFRRSGAIEASKYGAKGVLIRTLAPDNSSTGPHTGTQAPYPTELESTSPPIPAACVAIEDVEVMVRLLKRGHSLTANLMLPCYQLPDRQSRNIIFEIVGSELPNEVVIVGGHTDSWDCQKLGCQGAHDDGQGVILATEIMRVLHDGGWRPKRTIRAVLFVDEEVLQSGANAYADAHAQECVQKHIVAAIETDLGVGPVCGFGFSGSAVAREKLRELLSPLSNFFDRKVAEVDDRWSGHGVDISPMIDRFQVPGLLLRHEDSWWNNDYFHLHHSTADTIDHVDKDLLRLNFQVLIGAVWILANCDCSLARIN